MAANRKVPLAAVRYVNFHSDAYTVARRTDPIPQQTCVGAPCARYQPANILCENIGSDGMGGFQWKCEADLPTGLRFGKVDVSCEGWERPGDSNILHGSCGLTYDLVRIDGSLERDDPPMLPRKPSKLFDNAFNLLFLAISGIILYSLIRNVMKSVYPRWTPPALFGTGGPGPGGPGGGGGGGPGGGWGPGGGGWPGDCDDSPHPPPPYSKASSTPQPLPQPGQTGWAPGFFTGLAAGGVGAYLANRARGTPAPAAAAPQRERERGGWGTGTTQGVAGPGPSTAAMARNRGSRDGGLWGSDMGGGSGDMRRATGFGSSSVR
ncbi:uncharacterized protein MKK02DRAFT_44300 [Dioszegia hungarica]|uniref:Store-operated calcium entry-associated regulatory factor n=1 Tax=Dioszegia hungarica TaxID=4972 RepID=A0AA38LUK0_9TREE|nr:uncharacterized protein MKK02DRAFT_44300 [Dioszegia hungarica]KAI9635608.1 hypothetical protein MKK02DRAFT_44300 [Dioszegia hungarica]